MKIKTLDQAKENFKFNGGGDAAQLYAKIAREYHDDGMIEDGTLNAILREVDAYYINRDNE